MEVTDVLNPVVNQAPDTNMTADVGLTEEVTDVRIVLTGLIQGVVHLITMDIARLASNTCSQMTRAARKVISQRK